ncbi:hypothetical protein FYC62_05600 [Pedobacter aquae]|uniref:TonB-dependent receptor plug domain-containing protein n=1 Tax=Pedobacter aquae TaxID=2605747 RepID=A0A5C0VGN6_9SPHI|nr:hypothetical protein [Pedobacter aquae]QEK51207.1 hypothetical protein FYC62_05600 [Pedobacter aquae]
MKSFLLLLFAIIIKLNVFAQVKPDSIKSSDKVVVRMCMPSRAEMLNRPQLLYVLYFGKNQLVFRNIPLDKIKLKPQDIDSIKVLKDAIAINKYGEDAKNGVIEIKMKKEKEKIFRKENRALLKKG